MFTIKNLSQRLFIKNNVHLINNFRYVPRSNYYPKRIISNIPLMCIHTSCNTRCSENIEDSKYYKRAQQQYKDTLEAKKLEELAQKEEDTINKIEQEKQETKNEIKKIILKIERENFRKQHPILSKFRAIIYLCLRVLITSIIIYLLFLIFAASLIH